MLCEACRPRALFGILPVAEAREGDERLASVDLAPFSVVIL